MTEPRVKKRGSQAPKYSLDKALCPDTKQSIGNLEGGKSQPVGEDRHVLRRGTLKTTILSQISSPARLFLFLFIVVVVVFCIFSLLASPTAEL